MDQKLRKALCPDWCPKKNTDCNFECYDWEEGGIEKINYQKETLFTDTQKLLIELKEDARIFTLNQLNAQLNVETASLCPIDGADYSSKLHSVNNIKTMIRLKETDHTGAILPIEKENLKAFRKDLCRYMDTFAPNQMKLKNYILIISTYLLFIEKKPLHYVGMKMDDINKIIFDGLNYRCPVKQKYISEKNSLCRYCVALPYK